MTKQAINTESFISSDNVDNINNISNNSSFKDYIILMKPRVMSLVLFTAFAGMIINMKQLVFINALFTLICISMGAGASAVLNNWYDTDIDVIMNRTQNRPSATGLISRDEILSFGIILAFFAVFFMGVFINIISAFLLLFTIIYYIFIYTIWLKRSSIHNIVIGGVSGALPPMISNAAITGEINMSGVILFLIIFLWTPAHSWALCLFRNADYTKAKIPMMPAMMGIEYTKKQMIFYSILMIISVYLPYFYLDICQNRFYLIATSILNFYFIVYLYRLCISTKSELIATSRKLFLYSIIYLFCIFTQFIVLSLV